MSLQILLEFCYCKLYLNFMWIPTQFSSRYKNRDVFQLWCLTVQLDPSKAFSKWKSIELSCETCFHFVLRIYWVSSQSQGRKLNIPSVISISCLKREYTQSISNLRENGLYSERRDVGCKQRNMSIDFNAVCMSIVECALHIMPDCAGVRAAVAAVAAYTVTRNRRARL